jgi:hypothetical protein
VRIFTITWASHHPLSAPSASPPIATNAASLQTNPAELSTLLPERRGDREGAPALGQPDRQHQS